jgi:hypothetical protein
MTLLDLDGAGLDPTQPAPADFIQFLYDNSRTGYLTLWSHILAEPGGASRIQQWIEAALTVYHSRSLQTQVAPAGDKPAGDHVTEVSYGGATTPAAPLNMVVPVVSQTTEAGQLTCTNGQWGNEPTSYEYAWKSDAAGTGDGTNAYMVQAGDAGKSITCVVSATNAGGTTAAPPSNAIPIPAARAEAVEAQVASERTVPRREESRREYPKEDTTRSRSDDNKRR